MLFRIPNLKHFHFRIQSSSIKFGFVCMIIKEIFRRFLYQFHLCHHYELNQGYVYELPIQYNFKIIILELFWSNYIVFYYEYYGEYSNVERTFVTLQNCDQFSKKITLIISCQLFFLMSGIPVQFEQESEIKPKTN